MTRGRSGITTDQGGYSMTELLVSASLLSVLAAVSLGSGAELLARQRVEAGTRLILEGIHKGRADAERRGKPCGLSLGDQGWQPPVDTDLPLCQLALSDQSTLGHLRSEGQLHWTTNFPASLRFSANGLLIDGGTAVVWSERTTVRRCLVIALPLGVIRHGRYGGDPRQPDAAACVGDDAS